MRVATASTTKRRSGDAGARYLRLMLDRFERTDLALAAYNAGPTVVDRLGRAPTQETQTYVANVQQRWAALAGCN